MADQTTVVQLASRVDRLLLGSDWPHAEGTRLPADFVAESLVTSLQINIDHIFCTF